MSSDRDEQMREAAREVLRELMPGMLREAIGDAARSGPTNGNGNGHGRGHDSGHGNGQGSGHPAAQENGHTAAAARPGVVPMIPAPPVAAVLRPSTWSTPAVPGEIIGDGVQVTESTAPAPAERSLPAGSAELVGSGSSERRDVAIDARPGVRVEAVTIDSDEDLDAFARALAARIENPRDRRAIRTGALRFTLRRSSSGSAAHNGGQGAASAPAIHVTKGAVTERTVRDAAQRGARLVLARGAVLTPLARDQARALRVEIEREGRC